MAGKSTAYSNPKKFTTPHLPRKNLPQTVSNGVKWNEIKMKKALKSLENLGKSRLFVLAGAEGLEPTTHGFGDQYSTN